MYVSSMCGLVAGFVVAVHVNSFTCAVLAVVTAVIKLNSWINLKSGKNWDCETRTQYIHAPQRSASQRKSRTDIDISRSWCTRKRCQANWRKSEPMYWLKLKPTLRPRHKIHLRAIRMATDVANTVAFECHLWLIDRRIANSERNLAGAGSIRRNYRENSGMWSNLLSSDVHNSRLQTFSRTDACRASG